MLLKDEIKKEKKDLKEKCRSCGETSNYFSSAIIMGIKNIDYFLCPSCGFLQTEFPTWLDKAYKEAINDSDRTLLKRNLEFSKVVEDVIKIYFNKDQNFLDWGGGYGLLAGLMREKGYNFYLYEPYAPNLFAKNYVYENQKIELITCFEVFEHLVEPYKDFEKIFSISKNILFSTLLLPANIPDPSKWPVSWSYYGLEHGQHISFYQLKTLQKIAQDRGLNFYTDGFSLHLITEKNINTDYFSMFSDIKKTNWSYTKTGPGSRQSYPRRFKTGFIEKYMKGKILDIGYKGYEENVLPVVDWAIGVDIDYPGYDGKRLPFDNDSVDCVYASHVLEHIDDYKTAIREWFRVLKTGGYMIIAVPHMYLYEKRKHLPSMWNADHKRFYTPSRLLKEIEESLSINTYRIRHLIDDDEGYDYSITPEFHCGGSYQIEIVPTSAFF